LLLAFQIFQIPKDSKEILDKILKTAFLVKFKCQQIDDLLLGGLLSGELVEIHGGVATGKMQLCLNSCAHILLNSRENSNNKACKNNFKILYINVHNSFCIERFLHILRESEQNIQDQLSEVCVISCTNVFDLLDVLYQIENATKSAE
jgi:hypothetical protein